MHSTGWCLIPTAFLILALVTSCADPQKSPVTSAETPQPPLQNRTPAPQSQGRVTRIPLGDYYALQQSGDVLTYDVRPALYHSLGHIPGSQNWPKAAFARQLENREKEIRTAAAAGTPVVLYCTDLACPDARDMATWLAQRGHHIRVLEGGWEAWKAVGFPES